MWRCRSLLDHCAAAIGAPARPKATVLCPHLEILESGEGFTWPWAADRITIVYDQLDDCTCKDVCLWIAYGRVNSPLSKALDGPCPSVASLSTRGLYRNQHKGMPKQRGD